MSKEVTIGITKNPEFGEYKVFWNEGGRLNEDRACYDTDPESVVDTMIAQVRWAQRNGYNVKISGARPTQDLLRRHKEYLGSPEGRDLNPIGVPLPVRGHRVIKVDDKINRNATDITCAGCSQLYEGECRAYEMPHSQAEREARLRNGGKLQCYSGPTGTRENVRSHTK